MLVVTVEVWPGGDKKQRKIIGNMKLANVSDLNEISNYEGYVDGRSVFIIGHRREFGAWELIRRAIQEDDS